MTAYILRRLLLGQAMVHLAEHFAVAVELCGRGDLVLILRRANQQRLDHVVEVRDLPLPEMLAAIEVAAVTSAGSQPQDDIALVGLRLARDGIRGERT